MLTGVFCYGADLEEALLVNKTVGEVLVAEAFKVRLHNGNSLLLNSREDNSVVPGLGKYDSIVPVW